MKCRYALTVMVILFLAVHISSSFASPPRVVLYKGMTVKAETKVVGFEDHWFATYGIDANVTVWFYLNWFNYTVTGAGIQQLHNDTQPSWILINGVNKTVGDGWTFSGGTATITAVTSTAAVYFGQYEGVTAKDIIITFAEAILDSFVMGFTGETSVPKNWILTFGEAIIESVAAPFDIPITEIPVIEPFHFEFPDISWLRINAYTAVYMIGSAPLILTVLIVCGLFYRRQAPPLGTIVKAIGFTGAIFFLVIIIVPVIETYWRALGI